MTELQLSPEVLAKTAAFRFLQTAPADIMPPSVSKTIFDTYPYFASAAQVILRITGNKFWALEYLPNTQPQQLVRDAAAHVLHRLSYNWGKHSLPNTPKRGEVSEALCARLDGRPYGSLATTALSFFSTPEAQALELQHIPLATAPVLPHHTQWPNPPRFIESVIGQAQVHDYGESSRQIFSAAALTTLAIVATTMDILETPEET